MKYGLEVGGDQVGDGLPAGEGVRPRRLVHSGVSSLVPQGSSQRLAHCVG